MVELLAVEPAFPLYGGVTLEGRQYDYALLRDYGVLVRPELLAQLDVHVGDRLLLGGHPFTIRGVVTSEPGSRPNAFSFGPRAIVSLADLRATGLLSFGSRARYELLLRMPADAEAQRLARDVRDRFRGRFVSVRSFRATEEDIGEDLARAEDYLSLVGFVVVVLGGVGSPAGALIGGLLLGVVSTLTAQYIGPSFPNVTMFLLLVLLLLVRPQGLLGNAFAPSR
jgi:predicted lysophospholipase L1 biosynthesis ABC-type transport system permease subunit